MISEDKKSAILRNNYAIFCQSNIDIAEKFKPHLSQHEQIAATLLIANNQFKPQIKITTTENQQYNFSLDLRSRVYQSKGNWLWVKQFELINSETCFLTFTIKPRVMDIPYINSKVCAHWLFRNTDKEIIEKMNTYFYSNTK